MATFHDKIDRIMVEKRRIYNLTILYEKYYFATDHKEVVIEISDYAFYYLSQEEEVWDGYILVGPPNPRRKRLNLARAREMGYIS